MASISGENMIPQGSINKQKLTNAPNLISRSEPSATKVIMVDDKMRNDVSILFGVMGASVTPKQNFPINKRNMKSPAMSPPRKDPIPNQDINRLTTIKYQSFSPHLAKFPPRFELLINYAHDTNSTEDDCNDSTDTSRNEKEYYV